MSFLVEQGQTLVCLGDSITQAESGYVSLMAALMAAKYPDRAIRIVNAGIGGHKAPDMQARLERDVLAHRPQWVTISVGINDVWHGMDGGTGGVPLEVYEPAVEDMARRTQDRAAQVVLVTPTVIGEDPASPGNRLLEPYVAAMDRVAARCGCLLASAHADFLSALRAGRAATPGFALTTDGVHLNDVGNARLGLTILNTLEF